MTDDDYALEPVPEGNTVPGYRIAMVVIGIIIGLPAFIIGAQIGFSLGLKRGILSIIAGGIALSLIALGTGTVGARTRLNTAMIVKLTFGSLGGRIVSAILAVTTLGWFGVTAELFGKSVHQILSDFGWDTLPVSAYILSGGFLMVIATMFGFAALQRLSNVTVPLLVLLIAYTDYLTLTRGPLGALAASGASDAPLGDGISAIVGGLSVAVTIFPDLCRFSRTAGDARFAAVTVYIVAMPAILLLALIPSIITRQADLIVIMTMLGLGAPALVLMVVKAWATNTGNLYSAALSTANLLASRKQKLVVTFAGAVGILLAVSGISEKLIPFLIFLGVCIPPIAGIYVADFLWNRRAEKPPLTVGEVPRIYFGAFACWILGIAVAFAARSGLLELTGIAACDSTLVSAASFIFLRRFRPKLSLHPNVANSASSHEAALQRPSTNSVRINDR